MTDVRHCVNVEHERWTLSEIVSGMTEFSLITDPALADQLLWWEHDLPHPFPIPHGCRIREHPTKVRLVHVGCAKWLLTTNNDSPLLAPEEKEQIRAGARWLCHVANPFVDFHIIVTVGVAVSLTTTQTSQGQDNPNVQEHLKDL